MTHFEGSCGFEGGWHSSGEGLGVGCLVCFFFWFARGVVLGVGSLFGEVGFFF